MSAPSWKAVYALSLCTFTLIASEFLPTSLLTPMATGLAITQGQAGEILAVSGGFAVISSLSLPLLSRTVNRRSLVLFLTGLMLLSGVLVAWSPNLLSALIGRALLGVVVGGFWSISAALVMRLVPAQDVPHGLSLLNGGNALATTVAAPLASALEPVIGWRDAFFIVVPLSGISLLALHRTLPSLPSQTQQCSESLFSVLRHRIVFFGFSAIGLVFIGQFALFTYLRPFLEHVTQASSMTVSLFLLLLGVSGVAGVWVGSRLFERFLTPCLVAIPALMALIALAMIIGGSSLGIMIPLVALWGFIGTAAPTAWWTWLSRALPNNAEAGGGLMVALIQLTIAAGSTLGGLLLDHFSFSVPFGVSALCLISASLLFLTTQRPQHESREAHEPPPRP
ncbi:MULTISPECIES: MFS transporter [unclassified Saccharibacter]|uniref:MFS transporter n=1 Tax=unclassified Saccharibacter TaxID=2648722 RepID=UPI0013211879|nr:MULTISPECIES: MFS transporter [unclassified Saccharibacter]MXV36860.1 MFS transporter [Saccharibacter sp. EH611]MXV58650.1 MFS transporter [Saccharibacter sp. EH70]MXV66156.1 MFS transporter [Saccharibacter sp. EH60]